MKRVLVLFDIDGTLVAGGPAKDAFEVALVAVFGTTGPLKAVRFAGKTDPEIARALLNGAGVAEQEISDGLPDLWRHYVRELEERLPNRPYRALPGVLEVLRLLDDAPGITVGLVTGNIADGARLKLASAGIDIPLTVGAFGSDHEARNQLPGIAMIRANQHLGVRFSPDSVLVVGDTPRDIECGKHHGTRTLGVATGSFSEEELRVAGADVVLPDLSSTGEVVEILSLRRSA